MQDDIEQAEERANAAETRAAAWWEAAKTYCRVLPAQAIAAQEARNRLGEAIMRAEAAEDERDALAEEIAALKAKYGEQGDDA